MGCAHSSGTRYPQPPKSDQCRYATSPRTSDTHAFSARNMRRILLSGLSSNSSHWCKTDTAVVRPVFELPPSLIPCPLHVCEQTVSECPDSPAEEKWIWMCAHEIRRASTKLQCIQCESSEAHADLETAEPCVELCGNELVATLLSKLPHDEGSDILSKGDSKWKLACLVSQDDVDAITAELRAQQETRVQASDVVEAVRRSLPESGLAVIVDIFEALQDLRATQRGVPLIRYVQTMPGSLQLLQNEMDCVRQDVAAESNRGSSGLGVSFHEQFLQQLEAKVAEHIEVLAKCRAALDTVNRFASQYFPQAGRPHPSGGAAGGGESTVSWAGVQQGLELLHSHATDWLNMIARVASTSSLQLSVADQKVSSAHSAPSAPAGGPSGGRSGGPMDIAAQLQRRRRKMKG